LSLPGDDALASEQGENIMTHAITTLDERDLDAVSGGGFLSNNVLFSGNSNWQNAVNVNALALTGGSVVQTAVNFANFGVIVI
jgi:hypothetical protein